MAIVSVKIPSMENVSTGVLDKNKEHYLRCEDKVKTNHMMYYSKYTIAYVKIQKIMIYSPLCQT